MTSDGAAQLRFDILGPLEVWEGTTRLRLSGPIQERILVALLLDTGKVLPIPRLVAAAWGEDPPATAVHQVRKAIGDLRRRIGGETVVTDGPGYRAVLGGSRLDLSEFNTRLREAKAATAEDRLADAVHDYRAALALWRGPVLSGAGGPVIEAAVTALEERRLAAAEQYFDLRLRLGETSELVPALRELIAQHPLREPLRGRLMLALYRAGRQAEALEEYARVRELLAEELGVDPGPQLATVYEGILRESPPSPAEAPCTLPHDLADFTGREPESQRLLRFARPTDGTSTGVVGIDGMGGCGKTTLAVRTAHRLAADYPDGQLHIDLRGYAPGEQPVTTGTALDVLLCALGVPAARIPEETAARTALWRSALTGKKLLLLLDNAADAATVRQLLPTSPGCLVLVTSRARLVDLDGMEWMSLDVMTPEESATLVAGTIGAHRVVAEPGAAEELARLCGHLPLALRIATARLRNRPRWTVRYLADRLRDETRRLDELSLGERSVAATLRLSYQTLNEECRTAFRILALHPGGAIDVHAAAALLDTAGVWEAEEILELLLDVHLLQQPEIGLYTFHDLVRSFAHSLRGPDAAAVERLLDYYMSATERACALLFPGRAARPTGLRASTRPVPGLRDTAQAHAWFAREHTALLAAVSLAERSGHDRHTVCLARNVAFLVNGRGHLDEFAELSSTAVAAARRLGDLELLGVSLSNLGVACWKLGRLEYGIEVAQEGRDVAVRLGDRHTEAHSESTLGLYRSLLGQFPQALAHLESAVALERELGSTRAEAESLTILSALYEQWGRYPQAAASARRAVDLVRQLGQHESESVALTDLALAHTGLGEYPAADACLTQARALCDESVEPGQAAMTLALSADVADRLGRSEEADEYAGAALSRIRSSASPLRRAKVENLVGRFLLRRGEHTAALALHEHAHALASAVGYRSEEAYALLGMAGATEHASVSAEHRRAAEELFTAMGVPAGGRRG
ncbi:AfsR/SARP family transcriptional regulator [Streptomyces acidiscabies]|uniref:BTAD domain-containing putative transcriptional regulator n=4 Tax=Streptomyces acidiscabies TaxID=42234 RepID=A0AAP6BJV9_9ACTN|nr:BTAD domain-containing putative transcriptional regulator [Streptomyces acidiscabies]MBZ3914731.1 tetratricopeptide repeat protein [Streptomyces acidiscabies]MDX2966116.1 BTAD domain-containing putative transcriptional regulator [Streptomyces acidiscabies]MDX3020645.1 BTAD domain-containing putative transcriptional regulator [Streptomyces acidiscabies]MDX3795852.1 BTAD domain-containing putative transcriptional regulator [Streptomyces acidiscabies]